MPDRDYKEFASTSWSAPDLRSLKPHWSQERCEQFLEKYEQKIVDLMVENGWSAIHEGIELDEMEGD